MHLVLLELDVGNGDMQVRELEAELEAEQRRARDLAAENRKLQRLLQEQRQQTEDERRLAAEANEQINQLQARIKTLKRQLEEAVTTLGFCPGFHVDIKARSQGGVHPGLPSI